MKKIIWIIIAAVLLLGGAVAAFLLWPSQEAAPAENEVKLYWNVEQAQYVGLNKSGYTARVPRADGLYYIRFAFDGGQQELPVARRELVDIIDAQQVCGLVLDENGIVVDVQPVSQCTGGIAVNNYFVEKVEGNAVTVNMVGDFSAASYTIELDENTEVYNVGTADIMCGLPTSVQVDDQIYALWSKDHSRITHVFCAPYTPPGDIYWNAKRYYDSAAKISTRPSDATGTYTIDMYLNGEPVTFTTQDQKIVNAIDGRNPKWMGLQLNEEGKITAVISPTTVAGGKLLGGTQLTVTSIMGNSVSFVKSDGTELEATLANDHKVLNGTATGDGAGSMTQLQVGDIVYCLADSRDRICYSLVLGGRLSGYKMYWNVDRQWNKTTKSTDRRPDKDGWYYFRMAVDGQHITVKTNDLTIANQMESPVCCSLKLDGDVVVEVPGSALVYGGSVFASWYNVTGVKDGFLTAVRDGKTVSAPLAKDCEIYNTSSTAKLEGEPTDYVGSSDTVHCFTNQKGEIAIIYVVSRKLYMHAYWNSTKGQIRTPDADGWYYIEMTSEGKTVTVKTKDKAIVDDIDRRSMMLLGVNDGEVLSVHTITEGAYTGGGLWGTYYKITNIDGSRITASNGTKTLSINVSSNANIYDVSNLATVVGERTTLRVGDTVHSVKNSGGKLSLVYVTARALPTKEGYCDHCEKTVVFEGWDGGAAISKSGHYYLPYDVETSKHHSFGVEGQALDVVLDLNGKTYNCTRRALLLQKGMTFSVMDSAGGGAIIGAGESNERTHSGVIAIINATFNLYGGTIQTAADHHPIEKGGAITVSGTMNMYGGAVVGCLVEAGSGGSIMVSAGKTFNLYGGTVSGGSVNAKATNGGNICVEGTMNMYGGTVTGGKTLTELTNGGNIYVAGSFNMYGGTVTDGSSFQHGGNFYIKGTANLQSGTITGGTAASGKGHDVIVLSGKVHIGSVKLGKFWLALISNNGDVTLSGAPTIDEFNMAGCVKTFAIQGLTGGSVSIAVSDGEKDRVLATGCTEADLAYLHSLEENDLICADGKLSLEVLVGHNHCFCVGAEEKPEGHTCKKQVWQPITATTTISQPGCYYLDWSGLKAAALTVNAKDVYLCLNGANIRAQTTITLKDGASLTVCDCVGTGVIMTTRNTPVTVPANTAFTLISGTVTGTYAPTASRVSVKVTGGTFNMYGGAIKDGCTLTTATYVDKDTYGGNVQLNNGTFNMYGGLITGGKAGKYGGNIGILSDNGVFNMYGGKVTNGTAGSHGGNIAVALGKLYLYGGTVEGGTAATTGPNISIYNTSLATIYAGVVDMTTVYADKADNLIYKEEE